MPSSDWRTALDQVLSLDVAHDRPTRFRWLDLAVLAKANDWPVVKSALTVSLVQSFRACRRQHQRRRLSARRNDPQLQLQFN